MTTPTATVVIYTTETCPYCVNAKELLTKKNIPYTEIRVDLDPEQREEMIRITERRTVPQILIDGQPIGGFDDMLSLERHHELDKLLHPHDHRRK